MAEIKQLRVNGQTLINVPANPSALLELGVDPATAETLITEAQQAEQAAEQKQRARRKICHCVADPQTLLGTTADTTHLLLYGFLSLINKLHSANSLAEVREAAAPFAALTELESTFAADFLAKLDSGKVKLPFMAKGIADVVTEIAQRATAVAEVFESGFESNDKPDVESGTNPATNQNINPTADPVADQAVSGEG